MLIEIDSWGQHGGRAVLDRQVAGYGPSDQPARLPEWRGRGHRLGRHRAERRRAPGSASRERWPQDQPGYYPPVLKGLRGSHPGSFESAHNLRGGDFWKNQREIADTGGRYNLVVVGAGISGLAAAHFYRSARPDAKILILDNHDDFGGHAKRNEFHLGGRLHLLNGGTLEIDSPRPYSSVADGLLKDLGVDPVALSKACDRDELYPSLGLTRAIFFDRETFGEDRLVPGVPVRRQKASAAAWHAFLARTPLSPAVRRDIERIETEPIDYMPGLSSEQKKDHLSRISYRDYLLKIAQVDPAVIPFYQTATQGEWGVGIDAVSALDCWGFGLSGFQGLNLKRGSAPRMGYTPAGYADGGSYTFHFPDGNATIARLLVRKLIPAAVPGHDCRDVVTARVDYNQLDRPDHPVRIRLSSTVVRARNQDDPAASRGVEIAYARGEQVFIVQAKDCVLACWNMMIPYLCPELPEAAEDGASLLGQNAPRLYQRGTAQLARVPPAGHRRGKGTRRLSQLFSPEPGGGYWRVYCGALA